MLVEEYCALLLLLLAIVHCLARPLRCELLLFHRPYMLLYRVHLLLNASSCHLQRRCALHAEYVAAAVVASAAVVCVCDRVCVLCCAACTHTHRACTINIHSEIIPVCVHSHKLN